MKKLKYALVLLIGVFVPANVMADTKTGFETYSKKGEFAEVRQDLEDAIIDSGFVIDYVGYFNKMLVRTSKAVGSVTDKGVKSPYKNAQYLQFCAASLTHESVSADPRNIANCPVVIFVYEINHTPGVIYLGYRVPAPGESRTSRRTADKLEALLHKIVQKALE